MILVGLGRRQLTCREMRNRQRDLPRLPRGGAIVSPGTSSAT